MLSSFFFSNPLSFFFFLRISPLHFFLFSFRVISLFPFALFSSHLSCLFILLACWLQRERSYLKKKEREFVKHHFFFFTSSVCLFLFLFSFSVCVISPNVHRIHAFYFFMYGFTIKKNPSFSFFSFNNRCLYLKPRKDRREERKKKKKKVL